MQVLHYEVLDLSTPLYIPLLLIALSSILAILAGKEMGKWFGILIELVFVSIFTFAYITEDDQFYEYQKAIVEDWNIVHSEGWEVIGQEGEIVELKRELEKGR